MAHVIEASTLRAAGIEDVHGAIQEYKNALRNWADHHQRVAEDAKKAMPKEPVPEDFLDNKKFETAYQEWAREVEGRHQPYPMDLHHPEIMKVVQVRGGKVEVADYEVKEPEPEPEPEEFRPPELTLRQKKDALINTVLTEENRRLAEVLPPGRTRLMNIQYHQVMERDNQRMQDFVSSLPLDAASEIDRVEAQKKLAARKLDHGRPPEDQRLADTWKDVQSRQTNIQTQGAHLMNEVEDLSEGEVDSWEPSWDRE